MTKRRSKRSTLRKIAALDHPSRHLTLSWVLVPLMLIGGCNAPSLDNATNAREAEAEAASSVVADNADLPATTGPGRAATPALPQDVAAFKTRRDACDHFRGEEPSDEARAAELGQKLDQTCKGTDAELAALRRRYAGDAAVIAALASYDDSVE